MLSDKLSTFTWKSRLCRSGIAETICLYPEITSRWIYIVKKFQIWCFEKSGLVYLVHKDNLGVVIRTFIRQLHEENFSSWSVG